jgi:hypothetical protein
VVEKEEGDHAPCVGGAGTRTVRALCEGDDKDR